MAENAPSQFRQETFEVVAEALRAESDAVPSSSGSVARIALRLADEFARRNPRFKRNQFLLDAGVSGGIPRG